MPRWCLPRRLGDPRPPRSDPVLPVGALLDECDGPAYARPMRPIVVLLLLAASSVGAQEPAAPAQEPAAPAQEPAAPAAPTCEPPCRKGYFCRDGQCVSACNPPCPSGQICRNRECIADPNAPRVSAQPAPGGNTERKKDQNLN